jgi:hypothetical protein
MMRVRTRSCTHNRATASCACNSTQNAKGGGHGRHGIFNKVYAVATLHALSPDYSVETYRGQHIAPPNANIMSMVPTTEARASPTCSSSVPADYWTIYMLIASVFT